MGVSLCKGGNVSLTKAAPNLAAVNVGLGWDVRTTTGADFDLDASALICGPEGKVLSDVPDRWGDGVVTLLGDAAHAFPPSQAQGANQALEDAWLLSRALAVAAPVPDLLRRYEKVRARRVRRVSRLAATESTNRVPNLAGRIAWKVLSPAMAGLAYHVLIRRFSSVLAMDRI
jgi:FAD-dependent urate hydroxylase